MERLTRRLHDAEAALARFGDILAIEAPTDVERDAAIKRFEFTFEAVWKAAQRYLAVMEQIEAGSPGAVIRTCREVGFGDDDAAEARLQAAKDRNLTSHMYREEVAAAIFSRLPEHRDTLAAWFSEVAARTRQEP
ncbi:MAG: nucleotidyltransferase [Rhodospirillaceae bacterium]|nr:nucleotidyltransferase substrate binding protein [Rhodospirillaceae bacterium]MCY4066580.1 nucleotidyltransferase substrate binding protein [Rhodospirillaceae bacterium]MDE0704368.1 nucleotidyltransferase substrate binding protein [Rhodospirillaceae bacterium]MXW91765.1 nucleotidyltransferase [Rhodospirillaceae bacterium]MYB14842.1 nucleotidyltransferase [Rhodospirillaceae bacterium]